MTRPPSHYAVIQWMYWLIATSALIMTAPINNLITSDSESESDTESSSGSSNSQEVPGSAQYPVSAENVNVVSGSEIGPGSTDDTSCPGEGGGSAAPNLEGELCALGGPNSPMETSPENASDSSVLLYYDASDDEFSDTVEELPPVASLINSQLHPSLTITIHQQPLSSSVPTSSSSGASGNSGGGSNVTTATSAERPSTSSKCGNDSKVKEPGPGMELDIVEPPEPVVNNGHALLNPNAVHEELALLAMHRQRPTERREHFITLQNHPLGPFFEYPEPIPIFGGRGDQNSRENMSQIDWVNGDFEQFVDADLCQFCRYGVLIRQRPLVAWKQAFPDNCVPSFTAAREWWGMIETLFTDLRD